MPQLNDEELALCKKAFAQFDKDGELGRQLGCFGAPAVHNSNSSNNATASYCAHTGSGTIDVKEMKTALQSMGHTPSDEELFAIVHEVGQQLERTSTAAAVPDYLLHTLTTGGCGQQRGD
jgi:hypothetical protein